MVNHLVAQGRLVRDPELRHTRNGIPVCNFTIACERDYKDASGNKIVDFLDILAWRKTGELVKQYMTKGRLVVIEGTLQIRNWISQDGTKHKNAEVVADSVHFADSRPQQQNQPTRVAAPAPAAADAYCGGYGTQLPASDLDEPF